MIKQRALTCASVILLVAACGNSSPSGSPSASEAEESATPQASASQSPAPSGAVEETGTITVWIDDPRQPIVDIFKAANPELADRVVFELHGDADLAPKVQLANNVGEGWPDVVFNNVNELAKVSDASFDFPLDLRDHVAADVLEGFGPANAPCTLPDGRLVCLRNDVAPVVLWYNKPLMGEFGYQVPTTWEEYEALGERVAQEHPGYVIGAFGDNQAVGHFFWPSQCPFGQPQADSKVYINTTKDPECTRVAAMLDNLISIGTIPKFGPFSPEYIDLAKTNKVLMMPGASWMGDFVFGGKEDSLYYQEANGQLGIAPIPKWEAADQAWTGENGGGVWAVSKHTATPRLAAFFATWATTANEYQGTAGTQPAYAPAAEAWSANLASNPLYAADPFPVMAEAASLVDPTWGVTRFNRDTGFSDFLVPQVIGEGKTITELLAPLQEQLANLATSTGYEVVTTP